MRSRRLVATLCISLLTCVARRGDAQGAARYVGHWQGTLQTQTAALRLGLHVLPARGDSLIGALTSIDQGGAVVTTLTVARGDSLFVSMPQIGARYAARMSADGDTLRGVFTQSEPRPLVMVRVSTFDAPAESPPMVSPVPRDTAHHHSFVVTANGVRIHALDYGGEGPALVFIPGLGNTAHVFDDFAPRFTSEHHVVAITRVGFGESEQPVGHGYDLSSRVAQMADVMDSLGIPRAVLVGHSLGGDEITAFARTHPGRTEGLIYLDAAYDHAQVSRWQAVMAPYARLVTPPTRADLASANAFEAYQERTSGFPYPLGEVLALLIFNPENGMVVGQRVTQQVLTSTTSAIKRLDYSGVRAPALALYNDWTDAAGVLPFLRADSAANARATAAMRAGMLPDQMAERARFQREMRGARVESFRTHHYMFLANADETERRMRAWMSTLPTR